MASEEDPEGISIETRWVITRKGENVKARLVGQEFADGTMKGELFAGTPGLGAMNYLISRATTKESGQIGKSIALMDVKTAFLYGRARRRIYIRLPPEDPPWEIRS